MKTFYGNFVLLAEDGEAAKAVLDVFAEECAKEGWEFSYALKQQRG